MDSGTPNSGRDLLSFRQVIRRVDVEEAEVPGVESVDLRLFNVPYSDLLQEDSDLKLASLYLFLDCRKAVPGVYRMKGLYLTIYARHDDVEASAHADQVLQEIGIQEGHVGCHDQTVPGI